MPLSFRSASHGNIAFGFFNIDSDMLLLEHYFFFASDFCQSISDIAESREKELYESIWNVWYIAKASDIGDLMGAIHRERHTGFIGELYRMFPFPTNQKDFKQKPEGYENREIVKEIIESYASRIEIPFRYTAEKTTQIGDYRFELDSFYELIRYVWQGGYPRWKDELRPYYVINMRNKILQNNNNLFEDIVI